MNVILLKEQTLTNEEVENALVKFCMKDIKALDTVNRSFRRAKIYKKGEFTETCKTSSHYVFMSKLSPDEAENVVNILHNNGVNAQVHKNKENIIVITTLIIIALIAIIVPAVSAVTSLQ